MAARLRKAGRSLSFATRYFSLFAATSVQSLPISSPGNRAALTPVQSTSLLVAYWRDLETRSTEPLIRDEPAGVLVDAFVLQQQREEYEKNPIRQIGWDCLAVRTRIIDDWLLQKGIFAEDSNVETNKDGHNQGSRQIVNLGAGMCSRPYRLDFGSSETTTVFEVDSDLSLLQAKKITLEGAGFRLGSSVQIVQVMGDLRDADSTAVALQNAGFDPNVRTDWIAEGLFEYLDPREHHGPLLDMTRRLANAPGSRLAFQILEPQVKERFQELGVDLPYKDLVEVDVLMRQAVDVGWKPDRVFRECDLADLFQREINLPGFNIAFLAQGDICR
jgi:methyltransferase (TIGR00027 family)